MGYQTGSRPHRLTKYKNTMKVNWAGPSTVWLPTVFKISYFVFSRRKKFILIWNNLRLS